MIRGRASLVVPGGKGDAGQAQGGASQRVGGPVGAEDDAQTTVTRPTPVDEIGDSGIRKVVG